MWGGPGRARGAGGSRVAGGDPGRLVGVEDVGPGLRRRLPPVIAALLRRCCGVVASLLRCYCGFVAVLLQRYCGYACGCPRCNAAA